MDVSTITQSDKMTRFQILTVVAALFIVMVDGYDFIVVTFLAPLISAEFAAPPTLIGILLSGTTFGMVIGAFGLAPIADRIGRRPVAILSLSIALVGLLISAVAPSMTLLIVARIITGIGIGALMSSVGVILKEYSSPRRLGLVMGLFSASFGFGGALGGAISGPIVIASGWRAGFIVGAGMTALALVVAIVALSESLEYLVSRRTSASLVRLNRIVGRLGSAPLNELPALEVRERGRLSEIFGRGILALTVFAVLGFALLQVSFYLVVTWTPQALAFLGATPQLSITSSVFMGLGGIIGSLVFGLLSTWVRTWVLGAVVALLGAGAMVAISVSAADPGSVVAFAVAATFFGLAGISGFYAIVPGLYPAHARTSGFGFVLGVGRLAAIAAPILGGVLLDAGWSISSIYLLFAIPIGVCTVTFIALGVLGRRDAATAAPQAARASERV